MFGSNLIISFFSLIVGVGLFWLLIFTDIKFFGLDEPYSSILLLFFGALNIFLGIREADVLNS